MTNATGYRVHVSADRWDACTFMLLDVYNAATPEDAIALASRCRFRVTEEERAHWLDVRATDGTDASPVFWPDPLPEDREDRREVLDTLAFTCYEEDAL